MTRAYTPGVSVPRQHRSARVVRGLAAALVSTLLAATFHGAAQGHAAPLMSISAAAAFAVPIATVLVGRRLSLPRLAAAVTASQALFHLMLSTGWDTVTSQVPTPAGHVMHGAAMTMPDAPLSASAHMDTRMWFSHVVAAVVTTLVLAFGERLLLMLLGIVTGRRARRFAMFLEAARVQRLRTRFHTLDLARHLETLGGARRRGPPVRA